MQPTSPINASVTTSAQNLRQVSLDDKYTLKQGSIYLSGIQALVRLPLLQKWRDEASGLSTAGFISGYRGSPLGGVDEAYWKAADVLQRNLIKFQPGVNEDLALTSVWGSQQVNLIGPSKYDGVFGLWYAKGPGVDRSIDVIKHANHSGTSKHGGVLLVAGDDHGALSSTLPHQSDHVFAASMVPVLYPANVAEYIELGLHGWAMSRFSGCFVGFKALADTVESSASIDADPFAVKTRLPESFKTPDGGLHARLSKETLGLTARAAEALMQDYKIYAALAYSRENKLNRIVVKSASDRLGIIASGKSYMDVLEALEELGLSEQTLQAIGVRLFKVAMPWPLEPESVREFAIGLEEILVVEEKRQIVEYQLKEQLYNWRDDTRPRVIGKFDEKGEWVAPRGDWLLSSAGDFSVAQIARVIASRIAKFHSSELIQSRLAFLEAKDRVLSKSVNTPIRPAYYCSGCPHNTSTKVPEGSLALAGIGCHIMAASIYPDQNKTTTHMGGEGTPWIGQAPFSEMSHVFANLGDGTYFHSGYLAIRAALASGVNITYKILYNDAVAMTGGQPVDGQISVAKIASQVVAEGVKKVVIVTDDLGRYSDRVGIPSTVSISDRSEMDSIQRELRTVKGTSVLIYDQTCAAEKRRRRKKGEMPEPDARLFINEKVCEGCGDCGVQSNCTSILPLETEFGRKRQIDQSSCNKDYSCVKGFCPSFVTVKGATLRKAKKPSLISNEGSKSLPAPQIPSAEKPYNILITGIGGTGVITIGALLGMAAHLEGKGVSVLDMTGMSQKNGSVMSHVRISDSFDGIRAQRIATGEADLILGCDMLTAGSKEAISKMNAERTSCIINEHQQPIGTFAKLPDWEFPQEEVKQLIQESSSQKARFLDATKMATALMGDSIATNLFMLGFAYQEGLVPLSEASIFRAIELNGVAVKANKDAFAWGRISANDIDSVNKLLNPVNVIQLIRPVKLDEKIENRVQDLINYQDQTYANQYFQFVNHVKAKELTLGSGQRLTEAVAKYLYKLMAYKDEYEVARLYSDSHFVEKLKNTFEGDFDLEFNLAPPFLGSKDSDGKPRKVRFGGWMFYAFKGLAKLKFLRGTALDLFGYTEEREVERALITQYQQLIQSELEILTPETLDRAIEIARVPEHIRGYGHVKQAAIKSAYAEWTRITSVSPASAKLMNSFRKFA